MKKMNKDTHEKRVVRFAEGVIGFAQQGKKSSEVLDRYKKSIEYYNGTQEKPFRSKKMQRVWNKYAEIFENRIAQIVSKRPKWRYRPQGDDDVLTSDIANQVITDVLWDKVEWEDKGEDALLDCSHAGSGHIKTVIGDGYKGLPDYVVVPADCVDPDPKAKSHRKSRFIIHYIDLAVSKIKDKYGVDVAPDAALEKFQSETSFDSPMLSFESQGNNLMENVWAKTGLSSLGTSNLAKDVLGMARIAEIYIDDNDYEKIPFTEQEVIEEHNAFDQSIQQRVDKDENHVEHLKAHKAYLNSLDPEVQPNAIEAVSNHIRLHTQYPLTEKRKKYPYGRLIVVCQGKLLRDIPLNSPYTENEIPLHWRDMWIKWDYSKLTQSYWGKQLNKDMFDVQDAINHRKNSITQNIDLLNNGIKKLNVKAYDHLKKQGQLNKLNNLIANVVPVYAKDDLDVDFGSAFPPQIFQDLYHDEQFGDTIMGHNEVQAGRMPSASASGVTVAQLLQEGGKRANLAVKHYAFALQKMARNAIVILDAIGDDDLVFNIVNKNKGFQNITWEQLRGKFTVENIRIDVESFTGSSRQQKREEARKDYEMGLIDREAAYEYSDDPNKWETLKRMSEVEMLKNAVMQLQEEVNGWKGQFQNLSQNFIRQSISLEEERQKNKEKNGDSKKNNVSNK